MLNELYSVSLMLKLNERLFVNCLVGVTDEEAAKRISDHNNPFIWLVTHTTWARYNIAAMLGKPGNNPYNGMFEGFKPYDATMKFDSLEKIREEWLAASSLVNEGLETATPEHLAAAAPFQNPTGDNTLGGAVAFLTQHESYDIGQMGILKKYHTNEAMSYR
jgi:hypothetical protein